MRSRLRAVLALPALLALLPPAAKAQNAAVKAAAETINQADLLRDVSYLASDALLGRATPSPGYDSAAAYIVRTLKTVGVKPIGDNGTYLLHYTITRATLDTALTTATFGNTTLKWNEGYRVSSFLVPGVREGAVVYVGNGLRVPKRGIDAYAGLDIKGKWLLVHPSSGPARAGSTDSLGFLGRDYTNPQEEARARGALGIITIPAAVAPPADGRAGGRGGAGGGGGRGRGGAPTARDLTPTVGRAYAPYPLPQLTITRQGLEQLLAGSATTAAQILAADSTRSYPKSFELGRGTKLKVDFNAAAIVQRPYVVMGMIEGSDPALKNEWVVLVTHLDGAVGRGVTAAGDSIYNAADDNASGSAGNMSIARALMKAPRAKRPIVLIWDSGEETGLLGARYIAYGPTSKPFVALINMDMIGRSRREGHPEDGNVSLPGVIHLTGPGVVSTQLDTIVRRVERNYPFFKINRRDVDPNSTVSYPRTDSAPYIEQGIPFIDILGGLHGDYHQQGDEVAKLDIVKMEGVSRMVMAMLWETANDPIKPTWDKAPPPQLWFVTPRK